MTTTAGIPDLTSPTKLPAPAAINNSASSLGINDFLQLMSTQLQNQDPFKPLDSTAFVSQLAQFGQVSGIQNMQTTLQTLSDSMRASQTIAGSALIGHGVLATSDTGNLVSGGTLSGAVTVPDGASSVQLVIKDASGQTVRQIAIPADAGQEGFTWDGLTNNGAKAPTGTYTLAITAAVGGTSQALTPGVVGTVNSVSINTSTNSVTLNTPELGPVALSSVLQVG